MDSINISRLAPKLNRCAEREIKDLKSTALHFDPRASSSAVVTKSWNPGFFVFIRSAHHLYRSDGGGGGRVPLLHEPEEGNNHHAAHRLPTSWEGTTLFLMLSFPLDVVAAVPPVLTSVWIHSAVTTARSRQCDLLISALCLLCVFLCVFNIFSFHALFRHSLGLLFFGSLFCGVLFSFCPCFRCSGWVRLFSSFMFL